MMIDYIQLTGTRLEFCSRVAERIPLGGHSVTHVRPCVTEYVCVCVCEREGAGGESKQNTPDRQGLERLSTAPAGLPVPFVVSVKDSAEQHVHFTLSLDPPPTPTPQEKK